MTCFARSSGAGGFGCRARSRGAVAVLCAVLKGIFQLKSVAALEERVPWPAVLRDSYREVLFRGMDAWEENEEVPEPNSRTQRVQEICGLSETTFKGASRLFATDARLNFLVLHKRPDVSSTGTSSKQHPLDTKHPLQAAAGSTIDSSQLHFTDTHAASVDAVLYHHPTARVFVVGVGSGEREFSETYVRNGFCVITVADFELAQRVSSNNNRPPPPEFLAASAISIARRIGAVLLNTNCVLLQPLEVLPLDVYEDGNGNTFDPDQGIVFNNSNIEKTKGPLSPAVLGESPS